MSHLDPHDRTLDDRQTELIRRLRAENQGLWQKNRELEAKNTDLLKVIEGQRANIADLLRQLTVENRFAAGEPIESMVEADRLLDQEVLEAIKGLGEKGE